MKLGPKSKILIFFIVIVIIAAVLMILALLNSGGKKGNSENPTSAPSSTPNVININPNGSGVYDFAVITNQDTLVAFDKSGRKLDLNLDRRSWKDLDVSSDGSVISILGLQNEGEKFDLGLYIFPNKNFEWSTNLINEETGVLKYIWKDSNTLVFNQGEGTDEWLHRFVYQAKTEILKLVRNNDELISANEDGSFILYRRDENGLFYVVNSDGEIIWIESDSKSEEGNNIKADRVFFSGDPAKILYVNEVDTQGMLKPSSTPNANPDFIKKYNYYKTLVNNDVVIEINPEEEFNFIPVCATSVDKFLGYELDEENSLLKVIEFDIRNEKFILRREYVFSPKFTNFDNFNCINNENLLFSITESGITKWIETKADKISEIKFLENSKEVKPINH